MELDFTSEQQQIKDTVRRFLGRECAPGLIRKMREERTPLPRPIWRQMADMGWLGLPFEESYGGSNSDWVTLGALIEELGWACDPTPFADCILTCGWLVQNVGNAEQKQRWLPLLINGELMLSLAAREEEALRGHGGQATTLRESAGELRLDGRKYFVENAADSDFLLVTANMSGTDAPALILTSPRANGIELVRLNSLAHPNLYEVRFHDVLIPTDQLLIRCTDLPTRLATALDRTAAFQSVAAVGGARRVLEMAVDYAKQRKQFGKPIGSFQAVQHMLANTWAEVETAWLASYEAITYLEAGLPATDKVAIAKCASSEAFLHACFNAHQVFGGMGYMWETDLHLWTRKAKEIEMAGDGIYSYRRRLAACL